MKLFNVLAVAGAMLTMSAGIALAAEGCECCKDMAADAAMSCCDKTKAELAPAPAPTPAPEAPSDDAPGQAS
ncbi:MAG: ammonium transporter family protein [Brevundimonas sp.]|uniref:ammonium transporter family protein n=1 Tax=Brevundimonas sp. TaxID=1871086 RepID=UPI002733B8B3|nr:ammonium transporter family protein [Brevundimonas sp.]MDP3655898.1 ammonium transporter family protein [Brevundimonas sp.]MDZ4108882.1 ammonium transporter family protein [Brevundimonas sp.]